MSEGVYVPGARLTLKHRWFHARIGLCSGFRPCCVAFFSLFWAGREDTDYTTGWRRLYRNLMWVTGHKWSGCVKCPLCIARNAQPVEVKSCTEACGHDAEAMRRWPPSPEWFELHRIHEEYEAKRLADLENPMRVAP